MVLAPRGHSEHHKSTMYAEMPREAAQTTVGRWRDKLQGIAGDRTRDIGAARIGGERDEAAVVVVEEETILKKTKSTRMRAAGRGSRTRRRSPTFRARGRSEDAINGRPRDEQGYRNELGTARVAYIP